MAGIALNLDICDRVRAKAVQPRAAAQAIRKRLAHKNPNVVLLALGVSGRDMRHAPRWRVYAPGCGERAAVADSDEPGAAEVDGSGE
jgi:hypothetical protein